MSSPPPSSDRIAARTLGVGLVLLVAALGLARGFVSVLMHTTPPEVRGQFTEGSGRLKEFLDGLERAHLEQVRRMPDHGAFVAKFAPMKQEVAPV